MIKFMNTEIIYKLSLSGVVICKSACSFVALSLDAMMNEFRILWNQRFAYSSTLNGKAEWMFGTLKGPVAQLATAKNLPWDGVLLRAVH